jgi:hypothetical protein
MLGYKYKTINRIMNNKLATNDNVEVDAIAHEQCLRAKVD